MSGVMWGCFYPLLNMINGEKYLLATYIVHQIQKNKKISLIIYNFKNYSILLDSFSILRF